MTPFVSFGASQFPASRRPARAEPANVCCSRSSVIRESCSCPLVLFSPHDGETLHAKTILGPSHRVIRSAVLRDAPGTLAPDNYLLSWLLQKLHPLRDVPWPWMWLRDSAQSRPRSSLFHNLFSGTGV